LLPRVEEEMDQRVDAAIERGEVQLFAGAVGAVVEQAEAGVDGIHAQGGVSQGSIDVSCWRFSSSSFTCLSKAFWTAGGAAW